MIDHGLNYNDLIAVDGNAGWDQHLTKHRRATVRVFGELPCKSLDRCLCRYSVEDGG